MPELSIGAAFSWLATRSPESVAVRCGSRALTRTELDRAATAVAARWVDRGVAVDDIVTIALPNGLDFVVASVAAWKAGACVQPLSPRLPPTERQTVVELTRPALVIDEHSTGELWPDAAAGELWPDTAATTGQPDRWASSWKAPTSSGSTGRPKVIMAAAPARIDPTGRVAPFVPRDAVQLVAGPLHHAAPFTYAMRGLMTGHELVLMPRFDAGDWLDLVEAHRVTWGMLVPTTMQRILRVPGRQARDVSSLTGILHLGARCPEPVKRGWIGWLGPERVVEVYAGTESQGLTMIDGIEWLRRPGSVGRPTGGSRFRVVRTDAAGREIDCVPGEIGEILMRRDVPASRYLGCRAARPDGWHSLGDAGRLDADGYLYLADRLDDVIVTGAVTVYPADVEAVVDAHPAVRSSVVVGRPANELGNRVHAVVDTAGAPLTEAELTEWVRTRLEPEMWPHSWSIVDTELRDATGKARRWVWR